MKQTRNLEAYIYELQKLYFMLTDISESRLILLFIEIFVEPLKGLVKAYRPSTLQEALNRTRDLQYVILRKGLPPTLHSPDQFKNQRPPMKIPTGKFKRDNFSRDQDKIRRRKLCFTCQEPWVLGHKCAKGKEHYIEVFSESEVEEVLGLVKGENN